jgi:hypothetical protein
MKVLWAMLALMAKGFGRPEQPIARFESGVARRLARVAFLVVLIVIVFGPLIHGTQAFTGVPPTTGIAAALAFACSAGSHLRAPSPRTSGR